MEIKCELINRMIPIPQCIWNNFTDDNDYFRWIIYDTSQTIEEPGCFRKMYNEAFGYKKLGFINCYRNSPTNVEITVSLLTIDELRAITVLAENFKFQDYTDEEKNQIRLQYANHRAGSSLMCYEDCLHEEKLAILGRLVHLIPHLKDENGQSIPIIKNAKGELVEWPKDENGNRVHVSKLD